MSAAPRRRSLRRRVVAGIALVVVVGLLAAGTASVLALRGYLVGRTDDRLRAARDTVVAALGERGPLELRESRLRPVVQGAASDLVVHLLSHGRVVETLAADGVVSPPLDPAQVPAVRDRPGWLPSTGDPLRALAVATPGLSVQLADGSVVPVDTVVLVRDTEDDRRTAQRLVQIEAWVGAAVALAVVVLSWLVVGQGLRPLRRMAAAAERIAAGDRAERIPQTPALAETGALAAALDEALDERTRAEQRVRDFVADAAHELRTPLTSVQGWADLYGQGALDDEGVDRAMERIGREAARMRHLVDQLALLARLDADQPLRSEPVDLAAVVDDVVADLDVLAPDRPVEWRRPTAPVVVRGDRERLVQVVQNLVGNVLRHTPAAARLRLTVTAGTPVVLVVHDDGPGVPPELADRVFERFVRQTRPADGAAGGLREGSGLGLAIVAGIVRAHGGDVRLVSRPGEGTTVTVELPAG